VTLKYVVSHALSEETGSMHLDRENRFLKRI
jgi:hypothetical protein